MLKKIRRLLAAVTFILITLLILDFTDTLMAWLGWLAQIQFIPAVLALNAVVIVALVLLTLVFGRIYCSVICPLGVMQDIVSWIHGRKKKNRFEYSPAKSWLRYTMLGIMVVALAAGLGSIVALLAPYSTYARIVTNVLQPFYMWGNNVLAAIAEHYESYAFYSVDVWVKSLPTLLIAIAMLVLVAVLAWRGGRTYCNTICPVGTVLAQLARFSWFKVHIDADKCRNCNLCNKNCKSACIDIKNHRVDYTRCVTCGNCLEKCNFGALTYGHKKPAAQPAPAPQPANDASNTRRAMIVGAAVVAADAALAQAKKKVDGGLAVIEDKQAPKRNTPLTPPGSLSAANMARRCTACQLCVSACPNQVLRPSGNLATLMQPTMSYENGYCRPECNRCSQLCPTGAIQPIGLDEKVSTQIGHAVWIKKNCLAAKGAPCGNCARHCPSGAIEMVPLNEKDEDSPFVPAVNPAKCIGCGACEHLCPARPFSAIYVEGHEQHRTI
ncbi:MAG: 4Fe-4S dicluster domain-containing protein [Muribaculaceae bacterium]|nr:4Fe-4S dicluster domain-containing protein [Muribaculaceae bacterium]